MNKLISYFHLNQIGFLELMLAFFPIISGYRYGSIPMSLLWPILMDVVALTKKRKKVSMKLLLLVFSFVITHELIVLLINDANQTHVNAIVSLVILLLSIILIAPVLNYEKLIGSLYLVGLVSAGGIIYHAIVLFSGGFATPIPLPFLPTPDQGSRLFEELGRPSSFYWEPASFVTFMMVPLFISIAEKKNLLIGFWLICILLSGSTNGIVMAPAMVAISIILSQKKNYSHFISLVVLIIVGFIFFDSKYFDIGIEKAENTEVSDNVRLSNGPWLVSNMPTEAVLFGIPVHSVDEYIQKNNLGSSRVSKTRNFYLSDFWLVLVTYGVLGLLLHLSVYFDFLRKERSLLPYIVILLVAQFSQSVSFRSLYLFQICFIMCYLIFQNNQRYENTYNNNILCK